MSLTALSETFEDLIFSERSSNHTTSKMTKEGLLKDVHLIGLIGKSNRAKGAKTPYTYREAAIKEAVESKLYDGVDVYLGHSESENQRNPKDKIAQVTTGRYKEGVGALGDIQFNMSHPYFEAMKYWIDNGGMMMSQVADLRYSQEANAIVKIGKVHSVDIVINGNTTTGMFKEGVIFDKIAKDDDTNKLRRIVSTFDALVSSVMWPTYYSDYSSSEKKVLTDAEKAVLITPIAKDLVKELVALGSTKKEEATMEIKDITLEMLKKDRTDLVKAIESAAIEAETKVANDVTEAVKDIPADKRSASFLKLVREAIQKNDTALVVELVADRKALLNVKESATTLVVELEKKVAEGVKKVATTIDVKATEEALIAAFTH